MADDDIEKLLAEISGTTGSAGSGAGGQVARSGESSPARRDEGKTGGGRVAFAAISGVGLGVTTFVFGVLTPWTDALDMGAAGAFAAFVTALVAGPPRWFSS